MNYFQVELLDDLGATNPANPHDLGGRDVHGVRLRVGDLYVEIVADSDSEAADLIVWSPGYIAVVPAYGDGGCEDLRIKLNNAPF